MPLSARSAKYLRFLDNRNRIQCERHLTIRVSGGSPIVYIMCLSHRIPSDTHRLMISLSARVTEACMSCQLNLVPVLISKVGIPPVRPGIIACASFEFILYSLGVSNAVFLGGGLREG